MSKTTIPTGGITADAINGTLMGDFPEILIVIDPSLSKILIGAEIGFS